MSWRFRSLGTLFIVLCAAVIAVSQLRVFDRLCFPAHHLEWTIATDAEGAYTGFRYAPFDPSVDGALYPIGDMPLLRFRVQAEKTEASPPAGRVIALRGLLTPSPAQWPEHLEHFAPTPDMRKLIDADPQLAGRRLVQWDLRTFANSSWVPFEEQGAQVQVTGLDGRVTDESQPLSIKVPAAWGVLIFQQQHESGEVRVTRGRDTTLCNLSEQPLSWAVVPVSTKGHTPYETAATTERHYSGTFNGTDRVRFIPIVSKLPAAGHLLNLALDGHSLNLEELLHWPRGPGLALTSDAMALRVEISGENAWLELPEQLTRRSTLRLFVSWCAGTALLSAVTLALIALVYGLYRTGQWTEPAARPRGRGWIVPVVVALGLHLSYYLLAKPYVGGAGVYFYDVATHLWQYLTAGILFFYRTPAHIIFIWALCHFVPSPQFIVLVQQALSVVNVALVWRLARRLGLANPLAILAALAVACHPRLHFFANTLWSETLTVFLLLVCAELLLVSSNRAWWWSLVAGLCCAYLALCRPQYLFVIGLAVPLYLLRPGQAMSHRLRRLLICVVGFALLVSPWIVYNHARNVSGVAMSHAQLAAYYLAPEIPAVRKAKDWYGSDLKHTRFVRGLDLPRLQLDSSWEEVRAFHATVRTRVQQQSRWQRELYRRDPRGILGRICRIHAHLAGWAPRPADMFLPDLSYEKTRTIRFRPDWTDTEHWRVRANDWLSDAYPPVAAVVYVLAWLGLLCALLRRRIDWLLIAGLGLGNALLIPLILLHSKRYILPTEPFVLLLAVFAIHTVMLLLKRGWRRARMKT